MISLCAIAQKGVDVQYEPSFSYTRDFSNRWSSNIQITSRSTFFKASEEGTTDDYKMNFLETQLFGTYTLWNSTEISLGYRIRGTNPLDSLGFEHRPMQQIAFITYVGNSRLSHRARTEQRFREEGYENRWRYRLSYDKPLNGQRLDPGEKYIILSDELLYTFNAARSSLENRINLGIGWLFQEDKKLETGIQYRLGNIGAEDLENVIWFTTTYYLSQ